MHQKWKIEQWACEDDEFSILLNDGRRARIIAPDTPEAIAWHEQMLYDVADECMAAGMITAKGGEFDGLFVWSDGDSDRPIGTRWRAMKEMPTWFLGEMDLEQ